MQHCSKTAFVYKLYFAASLSGPSSPTYLRKAMLLSFFCHSTSKFPDRKAPPELS